MANHFYIDHNNQKQGPISREEIHELVASGVIQPDTRMETEDGRSKYKAGQIPGLFATTSTFGSTDIGFVHFLTPILIVTLWWLIVIATPLVVLFFVSQLDWENQSTAMVQSLAIVVLAVIDLLVARIILEGIAVLFRMERHQRTTKEILGRIEKASEPQS
jgi:hypothetical protein